jgi:hypothetical protein
MNHLNKTFPQIGHNNINPAMNPALQVYSPLPIRNPIAFTRVGHHNNFEIDLAEPSSKKQKPNKFLYRKFQKLTSSEIRMMMSSDSNEINTPLHKPRADLTIITYAEDSEEFSSCHQSSQPGRTMMRPPSRAANPHINDETFVRSDSSSSLDISTATNTSNESTPKGHNTDKGFSHDHQILVSGPNPMYSISMTLRMKEQEA